MAKKVFTAVKAYSLLCSDTESASEGEEDFVISALNLVILTPSHPINAEETPLPICPI